MYSALVAIAVDEVYLQDTCAEARSLQCKCPEQQKCWINFHLTYCKELCFQMEWPPYRVVKVLHRVCCITWWIISGLAYLCTVRMVIGSWN